MEHVGAAGCPATQQIPSLHYFLAPAAAAPTTSLHSSPSSVLPLCPSPFNTLPCPGPASGWRLPTSKSAKTENGGWEESPLRPVNPSWDVAYKRRVPVSGPCSRAQSQTEARLAWPPPDSAKGSHSNPRSSREPSQGLDQSPFPFLSAYRRTHPNKPTAQESLEIGSVVNKKKKICFFFPYHSSFPQPQPTRTTKSKNPKT